MSESEPFIGARLKFQQHEHTKLLDSNRCLLLRISSLTHAKPTINERGFRVFKASKLLATASNAGSAVLEDKGTAVLKKVHQHASERQQRIPTWGAAWHGLTQLCATETCEVAAGAETSCNQDLQRNKRSFHYCCSIKANVTGSCVGLPCSAERHDALRNKLGQGRKERQRRW